MSRISKWWGFFLALSLMLVSSTASVQAQTQQYAVNISGVSGQIAATSVLITGTVTNTLPWTVTDIKVVAIFKGTTIVASVELKELKAQESATFNIVAQNVPPAASTFFTVVGSYNVHSNDVSLLLEKYDQTVDDFALQAGIPQAFTTMTEEAIPGLLKCIDITSRPPNPPSLGQEVHDLMCLEGIRKVGKTEAATAVVDLLAWYEQQAAVAFPEVGISLLTDEYSPIKSFPLLQDLKYVDINAQFLAKKVLVEIGSPAVPALLYASQHASSLINQTAQEALAELNKTTIEAVLSENDPTILMQIVAYLQETPHSDAVIPLLKAAQRVNDTQFSAQVETCILKYGDVALQPLSDALLSPDQNIANQAESLLYKLAPGREALLQSILAAKNIPTDQADADTLVKNLRAAADAHVQELTAAEFSKGLKAFQTGDCPSSVTIFQNMFAIRHPLPGYEEQVSQAYACQLTALADARQVDDAIRLAEEGLDYMPGNQIIIGHLSGFYQLQADASYQSKDFTKAGVLWKKVLDLDPGNKIALQGMGLLNIRLNWLYLGVGLTGVLVLLVLGISSFNKEEEYE
jgi:hypothetical protein